MKTILVATDGSEHSERAVGLAGDLAGKYGAVLVILHAVAKQPLSAEARHLAEIEFADEIRKYPGSGLTAIDTVALGMPEVVEEHHRNDRVLRNMIGESVLKRAERAARERGAGEVRTALKEGAAATRILETAKAEGADLIVVGSRGLNAMGELFLGSVSHKVGHLSDINVLTVR